MAKNTICLWYDKDAEAAARFYAETFPNSTVGAVHRAPSDYPSGKEGDVLTVEFTVAGVPCLGLNGGPAFKHRVHAGRYSTAETRTVNATRRELWKSPTAALPSGEPIVFFIASAFSNQNSNMR